MVLERGVVVVFSAMAGVDDQRLVLGRRDDDDDAGMAGIDHDDDSRMVVFLDDDDPGVVRAGVEQQLVFVDSQLVGLVLVFEQQRGTVVLLYHK